ncbi:CoA-binding protein [Campylobacter sp. US33a]|uniref:CoA-binding protein n=1 Tax=Campylobacter sp. CCS1377 TaxID=3158229 RepID=A0AAU7EAL8_9BACT|nr:CoA-binding protein [Campylobacter sp. US33a]MCW1360608.1 CoA-binding protein [Campylobacter jejuni]TEY00910.1 CoA-binding protein [Campylobacter sp. US33a]
MQSCEIKFNDKQTTKQIKNILEHTKNIAIVGLSPDENKASHFVAKNLQKAGFKIYPIYPSCDEILGEKVYRNLDEISDTIDTVVMFRKAEFAQILFPIILKKNIKNFWLQVGIINDEIKTLCMQNHINFMQDRCIWVEFEKLNKDKQ